MEMIRTPDERFTELPDFPWEPHYVDDLAGYEGLRMHYLDEGAAGGDVYLCLHGEPTWAYLYRKMIPPFLAAGGRVIAPDFFGFGRSDKPTNDDAYTFDFHRGSLLALVERLDLRNVTVVGQDWGGILGLTLPMEAADRFARLLVMNTALPDGNGCLSDGFLAWREYVRANPDFDVGGLLDRVCPGLSEGEVAAYDAPFPDARYKAGVRRFPDLVPDAPGFPGTEVTSRAQRWLVSEWSGESFMAVGAQDPVLGVPVMLALRRLIRGCPEPLILEDAGHFVQEAGDRVAAAALEHWGVA